MRCRAAPRVKIRRRNVMCRIRCEQTLNLRTGCVAADHQYSCYHRTNRYNPLVRAVENSIS